MLLMTVGGPVYCMQLEALARKVGASLACADYAANGYRGVGSRANRREDWGNSAYLADVAKIPGHLRGQGVRISKLVLVGVSYSGFGNAELVATHPELRPAALIIVDSYLDLPARYAALPAGHPTKTEIERELGGTLEMQRAEYEARSPSHHLDGLAQAMNDGMQLVDVWSVGAARSASFAARPAHGSHMRSGCRALAASARSSGRRLCDTDATRARALGSRPGASGPGLDPFDQSPSPREAVRLPPELPPGGELLRSMRP